MSMLSTLVVIVMVALAILLVGVRAVGLTPYTVLSGSMEPTYHVGSLIYVRAIDAQDIEVGTPLTFRATGGAMVATHRVNELVTIDGETTVLPSPFVVMATQNPVESESTFRLPAAQMDRFLIRLSMGYPTAQAEREMLFSLGDAIPLDKLDTITSPEELLAAQQEIASVQISQSVADYLVSLVSETRTHPMVRMGASPRASRALFRAAKAWAAMSGRDFVTPDDIQTLAQPVLAHRLLLSNEARISGTTASDIIAGIVTRVPVPPFAGEEFHEA